MTKYEWEKELKKNIHRLPDDEIQRVLDYYDELFEDNIERGKSEREIVSEFGNPVDVADRILSEYDGELKEENVFTPPPLRDNRDSRDSAAKHTESIIESKSSVFEEYPDIKQPEPEHTEDKKSITVEKNGSASKSENSENNVTTRDAKFIVFLLFNILTGFSVMIFSAVAWIVLAAFTVAFGAFSIGGVAALVVSFGPLFGGAFGSGMVHIGVSIGLVGLGILGVFVCVHLMKLYAKLTASFWKWLRA